jgi:HSP20 family protein
MALVPWRPLGDLSTLRREMDRLFERFFGEEFPSPELPRAEWTPRLDMSETKDDIVVKADIPGLEPKDLDVSLMGDTLTIKGEKKEEKEEKDEHRHVVERRYGAFSRMVRLPAPVAADKIKASFKNGVLTITLPKTEEAKQKAIPIAVE